MKTKEVLYVLGLKKKLLSISKLDKKGYRVAFIVLRHVEIFTIEFRC